MQIGTLTTQRLEDCQPQINSSASEDRACCVCLDTTKDGLEFKEIRCAHDLCMECFSRLENRKSVNCPECRRPMMLDGRITQLEDSREWFRNSQSVHGDGRVYEDVMMDPFSMCKDLYEGDFGLSEVDAQEVMFVFVAEVHKREEEMDNILDSDDGDIVFGPRGLYDSPCIDRICSQDTERAVTQLIKESVDRTLAELRKRRVLEGGKTRDLLSSDSSQALRDLFYSRVDGFVQLLIKKHECPSPESIEGASDDTFGLAVDPMTHVVMQIVRLTGRTLFEEEGDNNGS